MAKFAGSQARALGAEIRRHRESLEWTLDQVQQRTGISRPTLSRIETGARRASVEEVASILTALGITGLSKDRLVRLASQESLQPWVGVGDGIDQQLTAVSSYEAEANSISTLQISVFPGLLQTAEYARMMISTSPLGSAERERAVFARVGRQSALTRPGLDYYHAFIDETAFQRVAGSASTMSGQLRHLHQISEQPRTKIRVLPFSAGVYWGCEGAFTLYRFGLDHCAVYQENQCSGLFVDDSKSTDMYKKVLDNLDNVALSEEESRKLISTYRERYDHAV